MIKNYSFTGQRNLDESIGLMGYHARFYSPLLNRFIQPDSIVPHPFNSQSYNRYSYVYNNPIIYTDPSGHAICLDGIYCGTPTNSSYQNYVYPVSNSAPSGNNEDEKKEWITVSMGGTIPAAIPGFSTQEQEYLGAGSPQQLFSIPGELNYYYNSLNAHNNPTTLNVYLTYALAQGYVNDMYVTVENHGTSSGRLNYIEIETQPLASMNSCVKSEICRFYPNKTVNFDPKLISTIHVCTKCLSDNINIYSMPKPIDVKGNYQATITVSMKVLYDFGRTVDYVSIPFNYTFPYP